MLNVLYIIIVRLHSDPDLQSEVDLGTVSIGDTVNVEVIRKQFELNNLDITVFGRIVRRMPKAPGALLRQHLGDNALPAERDDVKAIPIDSVTALVAPSLPRRGRRSARRAACRPRRS